MTFIGLWPSQATLARIESMNSCFSAVGFVSSKRITVSPPSPASRAILACPKLKFIAFAWPMCR